MLTAAVAPDADIGAEAPPRPNVPTSFNPDIEVAQVHASAYVDPKASVIGDIVISEGVYIAPGASARGDEGQPIFVGKGSNLQDGVVLHALETIDDGIVMEQNLMEVDGVRYALYIGANVSLAHQSHVHGPAVVLDDTFVGMQSLIFLATVGSNVVIEPGALIMGVTIPAGRYVPAGMVVTMQADADALPEITDAYGLRNINQAVLHVNQQLAAGYDGRSEDHGASAAAEGASAAAEGAGSGDHG